MKIRGSRANVAKRFGLDLAATKDDRLFDRDRKEMETMNTDQLAGKWKQMKGAAKQKWGKLTDDDLEVINGQRDSLIGKLQERYGMAKEEAQKEAERWLKSTTFDDAPQRAGRQSSFGH